MCLPPTAGDRLPALQVQDFEVFDNGVPQQIDRVLSDDASLEAWLVLDQSGSVRDQAEELEDAARTFLAQLASRDRAGLLTFRHGVTLHFGLSPAAASPRSDLRDSGRRIHVSKGRDRRRPGAPRQTDGPRDAARAQRRHGHYELADRGPVVGQRRAFRGGHLSCGDAAIRTAHIRRKVSAAHSGADRWACRASRETQAAVGCFSTASWRR